jgi:hypothetical protein
VDLAFSVEVIETEEEFATDNGDVLLVEGARFELRRSASGYRASGELLRMPYEIQT